MNARRRPGTGSPLPGLRALAPVGGAFALILAVALFVACGAAPDRSNSALKGELRLDGCRERGGYCGLLEPGGQLTAAAWLDGSRMYLADVAGRIRLLDVDTGDMRTVLAGLSVPQGLTVLNDRLYVTDMGNVCRVMRSEKERLEAGGLPVHPWCAITLAEGYEASALLEFLGKASARILSYRIGENGNLDQQRVIVDRIITFERQHSPNGLTNDGEYVYASIGHPQLFMTPDDFFVEQLDTLRGMALRTDLMGVIARIDSSDLVEVYAKGFRNVYGISVAPDGTIYGVDNDLQGGLARSGHLEELNAIREDGFHGYPLYGTNEAPPDANVIEPVAIIQGFASTATHANNDGIYAAYIFVEEDTQYVVDRFDYETFTPERVYTGGPHYITAILERGGILYIATLAGDIHVIDPNAAPVLPGARLSSEDMERILLSDPLVSAEYDIYSDKSRLVYIKNDCEEDRENELWFSLHVYPVRPNDLPEDRREHGFENLDFNLARFGWVENGVCIAVRRLPDYEIDFLRTGQYTLDESDGRELFDSLWTEEISFRR